MDQGQEPGGAGLLYHGIAALISRRHATLIDLPRLHTDDRIRERGVRGVEDPETLRFWTEEFPGYTKSLRSDAIAPILNKAGQIAASPHLRLILGQVAPRLDLSFTMNNRRILIANLAKGAIGEQAAIFWDHSSYRTCSSSRWSAAHSRQHSGSRSSPTSMNSKRSARRRSRRFCRRHANSRRIFANQYADQLSPAVRSAVIGNAGTLIVFLVGRRNAELLAPEFRPMDPAGLADQEPHTAWLRRVSAATV